MTARIVNRESLVERIGQPVRGLAATSCCRPGGRLSGLKGPLGPLRALPQKSATAVGNALSCGRAFRPEAAARAAARNSRLLSMLALPAQRSAVGAAATAATFSSGRLALAAVLLAAMVLAGCAGTRPQPATQPEPTPAEEAPTSYEIREEAKLSPELQRDFARALQHLQAEEYEQGIALLTALSEHPQAQANTAPHINLAIAYRRLEKFDKAEESLKKALAINPEHPVANNEYGMVLRKAGRFQEARSVYEQVVGKYPEFLPARKNLGILCELFIGDLECALEQYVVYNEAIPDEKDLALWIADLQNRLRSSGGI